MHQVTLRTSVVICIIALCYGPAVSLPAADPEDSTVFVLPHVVAQPGETINMPFSINTIHDIGGFIFIFSHASGALEAIELTQDGTRSEGLGTLAWGIANSSPDVIVGVGVLFPDFIPAGDGPVANLIMDINQLLPFGCLLPLTFFNESGFGARLNAISDPEGWHEFDPDFNNGSILIPLDTAVGGWFLPGDVNVNAIGYEIADLVLMEIQLSEGIDSYWHEAAQARNSDVNVDLLPWTIADFLVIFDVVNSTLLPPPEETITEVIHMPSDSIWFEGYEGTPVDTLEIPIYIANSIPAGGLSFKLSYSSYELEFVSYSLDGTRMPPEWSKVSAVERSDGLMFFATTEFGSSPQDNMMPTGDGLIVTLKFAVHTPVTNFFDVHFERLQHHGQVNGYGTFEWPYWHLASFQNVDKAMHFSFIYGDADGSGFIDIDDVVYLIQYVFNSGPPPPVFDAGDFNRDFFIDIDDVIALLGFIFG